MTESLPDVPASAVTNGQIVCPNCRNWHGVFYRKGVNGRTLHYCCNKVKTHWVEGEVKHWKYTVRMGNVGFVDNLPVKEEWTPSCKASFQKEHQSNLL